MNVIIYHFAYVVLSSAFWLLLFQKWNIIEWVQVHGNDFFSKMFHCNFCLSFWMSSILTIVNVILTGELCLLITPILATPLIRKLL